MISLSGSLTLHDGPTPPLLEPPELVEPELLAELVEPELLLVEPELLALLVEPELLALLVEPELEPVSGAAESSAPASALATDFGGSFTLFSSGGGSADLVSSMAAPSPSSGDVAHAERRARTERAPTAMRLERRMAGTVAAELCMLLGRPSRETR
ncbi:MAG: hypothetical protein JWP87_5547 [Labilithrix sp.]|nr:hypothetical protein [Labilithrix sp.]